MDQKERKDTNEEGEGKIVAKTSGKKQQSDMKTIKELAIASPKNPYLACFKCQAQRRQHKRWVVYLQFSCRPVGG